MKDSECQTESTITDVGMNITKMGFIGFINKVLFSPSQKQTSENQHDFHSSHKTPGLGGIFFQEDKQNVQPLRP